MKAIHINWTWPFLYNAGGKDANYYIEDFEILTTILSALKWREHNGSIKLYTDKGALDYYEKLGILGIWDLGVDTRTLENSRYHINPYIFWAAGKIMALEKEEAPVVMIDTDFIVWRKVTHLFARNETQTIHKERLTDWAYTEIQHLSTPKDYAFDEEWSWDVLPCNTAFAYFGDSDLKQYYTGEALRFMEDNLQGIFEGNQDKKITHMVFAEQRLLSMCAAKKGKQVKAIMELNYDSWNEQEFFTHLWSYKNILRSDIQKRNAFCKDCISRITSDYPDKEDMLRKMVPLEKYFKG